MNQVPTQSWHTHHDTRSFFIVSQVISSGSNSSFLRASMKSYPSFYIRKRESTYIFFLMKFLARPCMYHRLNELEPRSWYPPSIHGWQFWNNHNDIDLFVSLQLTLLVSDIEETMYEIIKYKKHNEISIQKEETYISTKLML